MFFFPKSTSLRVPAKHADGPVKLQRVRIFKSRARPLAVTVLAFPLAMLLVETREYWLPDRYQKTRAGAAEDKRQISNQQAASKAKLPVPSSKADSFGSESKVPGNALRPQDVSFMLPLPIIEQRRPVPYEEADKEWIAASKLMEDSARVTALKKLIIDETMKGWAKDKAASRAVKRVIGAVPGLRIEESLQVVVPLFRPPQFDMYWLVFLPEGPKLARKPLSSTVASRINRIWYPKIFFQGFWNAGKVFTYASYDMVKKSIQSVVSSDTSNVTSLSSTQFPPTAAPTSSCGKPGATTSGNPDATGKNDDQVMATFRKLGMTLIPEQPLAQAKMAFLKTSFALQIQALQQVPEGAVVFQGYVAIVGLHGKVRSRVSAIYLPAQDRLICPVIIDKTEILPSAAHWHKNSARPQLGHIGTNGKAPTSQIVDLKAKVDHTAEILGKMQVRFESVVEAQNAYMEARKKELSKAIQKLEDEMGGEAAPNTKKVAATKVYYTKMDGDSKLSELLNAQSDSDPRLEKLITRVASGKASAAELKDFASYSSESNAIILAKEIESRRVGFDGTSSKANNSKNECSEVQPVVEKEVNEVNEVNVTKDVKKMKDIQSEKTDEGEEAASDSIQTSRKEERKKG